MNFTPQELRCIAIYRTERQRQSDKQAAMIAALLKIAHEPALKKMNMDSESLMKLVVEQAILRKNQKTLQPYYTLSDSCNVIVRGVTLKHLGVLHQDGVAQDKNWKDIERKCLLCCVRQNNKGLFGPKTSLQQLFIDISLYFDRTPAAISREWNNIKHRL